MIKNILFDFGNVIIDLDVTATQEALLNIKGLNPKKLDHLFNVDMFNDKFERGELFEESFFNAIQRCCEPVPQIYTLFEAWNAMLIGIPERRFSQLLELKKTHRTFLYSNTNVTHLRWIYSYLKKEYNMVDFDSSYFEKTYYSHDIGYRKPEPEGFEYIIKDATIKPEETLFIDDMKNNTDVAASLGFQVYHHNPAEDIFDALPQLLNKA